MTVVARALLAAGLLATPLWNLKPPAAVRKLSVVQRCDLVAAITTFRLEIHPGEFRVPLSEDQSVKGSASWHDTILICPAIRTSGHHDLLPFFGPAEACAGGMTIHSADSANAADLPEMCLHIELVLQNTTSFRFEATLGGIKVPLGVGVMPVEGVATRKGDGWILKQLFKPKPRITPALPLRTGP